jgi:predicted DNA-binding transcriptional regulator AlpA
MKRRPNFPNFPPIAVSKEDCLLTTRDVARLLAVSAGTVKDWRNRSGRPEKGPEFIRFGGSVRYALRAVRKYLSKRTVRRNNL